MTLVALCVAAIAAGTSLGIAASLWYGLASDDNELREFAVFGRLPVND